MDVFALTYIFSLCHPAAAPLMSLLQKTPSSPVSCHVTGFYPANALIFWRRDGQEVGEDVQNGEVLPNHDGTFQKELPSSLIEPEDWWEYECVFFQSGVKEISTRLDRSNIITNWGETRILICFLLALYTKQSTLPEQSLVAVPPSESPGTTVEAVIECPGTTVVAVIVPVLLLLALCIVGLYLGRRKCKGKEPDVFAFC